MLATYYRLAVVLIGLWSHPREPGLSISRFAMLCLPGLLPQHRMGNFSSCFTSVKRGFSCSSRPLSSSQWIVERANVFVHSTWSPCLMYGLRLLLDRGRLSWSGSCLFLRPWQLLMLLWSHSSLLTSSAYFLSTSRSSYNYLNCSFLRTSSCSFDRFFSYFIFFGSPMSPRISF